MAKGANSVVYSKTVTSIISELSDFEKAALDEAKRSDISKMPAPTIDSINANISKKASERAVEDGIT